MPIDRLGDVRKVAAIGPRALPAAAGQPERRRQHHQAGPAHRRASASFGASPGYGGRRAGAGQPVVLAQQQPGHPQRDQHEGDVGGGKGAGREGEVPGADEHHPGRQHVAAADEEGVDGLLGGVLLLAAGRQPQHLLGGVHHRVVAGVLGDLDPAQQRDAGARQGHAVGAQRHDRQREQRSCHAQPLDDARHHEHLQDDRRDVHAEEVAAVERPDEGALAKRRVTGGQEIRLRGDQVGEDVLAGRVDDVEKDQQQGDQPQIAAVEDQREPVRRGLLRLAGLPRAAAADEVVQPGVQQQQPGGDLHHRPGTEAAREQLGRHRRPDRRAGGGADGDHREQPIAFRLAVDVVGEGPELGDQGQAEDADEDVEREADPGQSGQAGDDEELDHRHHSQVDPGDQPLHRQRRGQLAVERHVEQQHERLCAGRVGLQLGAAGGQDQRLTDGLQDVVGDQQQEDAGEHQQDVANLAGRDVAEQAEEAGAGRGVRGGGVGHGWQSAAPRCRGGSGNPTEG